MSEATQPAGDRGGAAAVLGDVLPAGTDPAMKLRQRLRAAAPDERRALALDWLRCEAARILERDAGELAADRTLVGLGFDSLAAAELAGAAEGALGARLDLAELLDGATAGTLADSIARQITAAGAAPLPEPAAEHDAGRDAADNPGDAGHGGEIQGAGGATSRMPLSWGQRSLWLVDRLAPGNPSYILAGAARTPSGVRLDAARLRSAAARLVARHPALRTRFETAGDEAVQVVAHAPRLAWQVVDLGQADAAQRSRAIEQAAWRPFDLERGPLLRLALLRGRGSDVLVLAVHHIVADFASLGVIAGELGALYTGRYLPPPPAAAFAALSRRWAERLAAAEGAQLAAWWRAALPATDAALELPTDRQRPAVQGFRGGARSATLEAAVVADLDALGRRCGATRFTTLLAAFMALLHRHSGQAVVRVGTPTAGRGDPAAAGVVGYLVNPLVVRAELDGNPSLGALLGRVRHAVLAAFAHQGMPVALLAEIAGGERDASRPPLFQAMFVLYRERHAGERGLGALALGQAGAPIAAGGLALESVRLPPRGAQVDVTLLAAETAAGLTLALQFDAALFDGATAGRMLGHLCTLAAAGAATPDACGIGDLPLLGAGERQQLLVEWNATATAWPPAAGRTLHALFEAQARCTPDAVAVAADDGCWSYRGLDASAAALAAELRAAGAQPDRPVAICAERSAALPAGLLAILKAGAAYLPLDPDHPVERLGRMLAESAAPVLLVQRHLRPLLGGAATAPGLAVLDLDPPRPPAQPPAPPAAAAAPVAAAAAANPATATAGAQPGGLAYVIYTSGSTGQPKGTMNTHRGIVNRLLWMQAQYGLRPDDRVLQKTPMSFDVSVWELFWPLAAGACMVMARPGGHRDAGYLTAVLEAQQITTVHFVPAMLSELLAARPAVPAPASPQAPPPAAALRRVIASGEALSHRLQQRYHQVFSAPLHNLYGPTEAAVDVTHWTTQAAPAPPLVPIGRPVANTWIRLLDPAGRQVPIGVPGELCIGGVQLARGYLGQPALTAERFVPDPLAIVPGTRLYRTGDRARHLPDGAIDFLGRFDHQVKIRGVRIEPGEVEAALMRHPAVREAVVTAPGGGGHRRLVAHLVARPDAPAPATLAAELRGWLARSLPEAMIPSAFVTLAALPLSPNGKVDRRALPAPAWDAAAAGGAGGERPRTAGEEILAGLFAEVLAGETAGASAAGIEIHANFFELGGHSLLATRLLARVRQVFGVDVTLRQLFAAPTVAQLWTEIAAATDRRQGLPPAAVPPLVPLPPAARQAPLPLSLAQEWMWLLDRLEAGGAAYNMPGALRLAGPLRVAALRAALAAVVNRHEILRTTFVLPAGEALPLALALAPTAGAGAAAPAAALPLVDLTALPAPLRTAAAAALGKAAARRPFDLSAGSRGAGGSASASGSGGSPGAEGAPGAPGAAVLRALLLHLEGAGSDDAAARHLLLVTLHHIAADGASVTILARELAALYTAAATGAPAPAAAVPALPVQYADYAAWQRQVLAGERWTAEMEFWRRQLAGERGTPPSLALPWDRSPAAAAPRRAPGAAGSGARRRMAVPAALGERLAALSRTHRATLFMTLLAAFDTLLGRHGGQQDIAVGVPVANRDRAEIQGLIGLFVNTLVLRADLSGNPSFIEVLERVRGTALAAYAHQEVPFEQLVAALQPRRTAGEPPFFQVVLAVQPQAAAPAMHGLEVTVAEGDTGTAKFDLALVLAAAAGGALEGHWIWRTDRFEAATIGRLAGQLLHLLAAVAGDVPGLDAAAPAGELPLLAPAERHQLLHEWNDSWLPGGGDLLHAPALRRAAAAPDAVAAVEAGDATGPSGGHSLSYGALAARAARLAARLAAAGVAPEAIVGIAVEPSAELLIGLLGILAAGGAYLPIDTTQPHERQAQILADSRARWMVTAGAAAARLPPLAGVRRFAPAAAGALPEGAPATAPPAAPDTAAYVLYTSGSTGVPKGVVVSHRSVVNRLRYQVATDLAPDSRVLARTRLAFDVSIIELLAPLWAGGTVVLADAARLQDGSRVAQAAATQQITNFNTPPALLPALAAHPALRHSRALRRVVVGGERLPEDLAADFAAALAGGSATPPALVSRYGPTEATVSVAEWRLAAGGSGVGAPLGWPITGARLHVLDRHGRELPPGAAGELCIGGLCLARGYLARPDLTAAAFVPDPFAVLPAEAGRRLYRTGDLARRRSGGELEFLGRIDRQVKIRGFRVELGEVEAAIRSHPAVHAVAVVDRDEAATGARRLVAYVVPAGGAGEALDTRQVRAAAAARLPPYMLPAAWVVLDRLPLTANGKLDRQALPEPAEAAAATAAEAEEMGGTGGLGGLGGMVAASPVAELLAALWCELLGVRRVAAGDNFFELGGHSLVATQLVSRLRATLAVELPLAQVFEHPTLQAMAATVEAARGLAAALPPIEPAPRGRPLPLSYAQERLWFLDRLVTGRAIYNMPVALAARGNLVAAWMDAALSEVVRRHEALRTTFAEAEGGVPEQRIQPARRLRLPQVDLGALPAGRRRGEALRLARDEAQRPFDLARGPLLRGAILLGAGDDAAADQVLLLDMHHIASDGWSAGVLIAEIRALYGAAASGEPSPLPALRIQYGDYAVWQRRWLEGERMAGEVAWWRAQLAGAPTALSLPTDRQRPPAQSYRGATAHLALEPAAVERLKAAGRRHGATPAMVLLAGFAALLARLGGQDDLLLGSPIANRHLLATEPLIGFFVNSLALRCDLRGDPPAAELLARIRETALGAYAHQDMPFERLVEEIRPERRLSHNPLFQAMCVLQNAPRTAAELPGLSLARLDTGAPDAKFDLALFWWETAAPGGGRLEAELSYAMDLFDPATAARLLGRLELLLDALATRPATPLAELPLLAAAERHQLLAEWQGASAAPGLDVVVKFQRAAAAAPSLPAVIVPAGGGPDAAGAGAAARLSFGDLDAWSNRVARRLRAAGVGPETRVALAGTRGPAIVAGMLGILKAGGTFVPLDPVLPAVRLAYLLADSGAAAVAADPAGLAALPLDGAARSLPLVQIDGPEVAQESAAPLPDAAAAAAGSWRGHLAYFIYTSGTTGWPKASGIERGSVADVLAAVQQVTRFGPGDRVVSTAPVSFDFFALEVLSALGAGAATVLVPNRPALDFDCLAGAVRSSTGIELVPAVARHLLNTLERQGGGPVPGLRRILIGGDRVPGELLADLQAAFPNAQVWVIYGPTETTMVCMAWLAPRLPAGTPVRTLLGRPFAGCRIELHDRHGLLVPIGVPGEVWIGGVGLTRGYIGRPELTAERYRPAAGGARLYRSGDLAVQLADGSVEFLGRIDHQVKLRGFRIETAEIEAVLASHPGVREAVVVARTESGEPGPAGDEAAATTQLVAYVVRNQAAPAAGPSASAAAPAADHIAEWQELYEDTYTARETADPTLNLAGWNSSYTGKPIPEEQMRQWVDATVERLLALAPRRVIEVGCGTGLLLFRVAPHCERYHGLDFSRTALDHVAAQLSRPGCNLPQVTLAQGLADDWSAVRPGDFDCVILNSIVQYFPTVDYLMRVLQQAVAALPPGGRVFLGDLRSLPLDAAFATSVELATAPDDLPVGELRRRIERRRSEEDELLIAPELFVALARHLPAVARAEVWKKRGLAHNELTRFRFDAVLTVGPRPAAAAPAAGGDTIAWPARGMALDELWQRLGEPRAGRAAAVAGIPDRRLAEEAAALTLLAGAGPEVATAGRLRAAVAERVARQPGVDPEELAQQAARHGWEADLVTTGPEARGGLCFTALLRPSGALSSGLSGGAEAGGAAGAAAPAVPPAAGEAEPAAAFVARAFANDPLRGRLARELVPELRRAVRARLPDYMMPSAFVVLDAFPLTAHGKVDREALPAPGGARPILRESYVAPRLPLERGLAEMWADLLGLDRVGVHDDFFELGGHSLLATQLVSRVRDRFGVELPVRVLFEEPTVAALAAHLAAAGATVIEEAPGDAGGDAGAGGAAAAGALPAAVAGAAPRRPAAIQPQPRQAAGGGAAAMPLSFAQQRLWFLDRLAPGSAAYNVPLGVRLSGRLDVPALAASVAVLTARHETLRTTFHEAAGEPWQRIAPPSPATAATAASHALPLVDLTGLGSVRARAAAAALAEAEARRPFDLARGPLFRPLLLRVAADEHLWLGAMHHIISDGWSLGVLVRELSAAYGALVRGAAPDLPALPVQYADFAVWQRRHLTGEALAAQIAHWRERLAGLPERLDLPVDRPRPAVERFSGSVRRWRLAAGTASRLRALATRAGATPFMVLLAAFQAVLGRWAGQDDLALGTPIAGRGRSEIEGLIGFFVNTLVLRADLAPGERDGPRGLSFATLLARTRDATLAAYAHQDLPFERLVEELGVARNLGSTPLFQVLFALQNAPAGALQLPGLLLAPLQLDSRTAKFEMTLSLAEAAARSDAASLSSTGAGAGAGDAAGGFGGWLEYRTDLFDTATIARLLGRYDMLLERVSAGAAAPLAAWDLLSEGERHQLLVEWARGPAAAPQVAASVEAAPSVAGQFAAAARRTPDAVAVVFEAASLTYAELDRRAARLARRLTALGVAAETPVALCLERSLDMMAAILGILRAGGAYAPLDPGYPQDRLRWIAADLLAAAGGRAVVVTRRDLAGRFGGLDAGGQPIRFVFVDEDGSAGGGDGGGDGEAGEAVELPPAALAYVIYTSGSTGRPKGTMNTHQGILNRVLWMQSVHPLAAGDRVLQKTPLSFDVSVGEMIWPLLAGACLVVARPEGHKDAAYLVRQVRDHQVTTLHFVPSMLEAFADHPEAGRCRSLRRLVASGEALSAELRDRFLAVLPGCELYNLYGPTEAAVDVAAWTCRAAEPGPVPIGRPVADTRLHVLDLQLRPRPMGAPGELLLGGVQLARGYLGRPDLTAERFVPDPWTPGGRLYRTGDLVRHRSDGAIEYLGRLDTQVKLRGFRIELGEIETVLAGHPAVRHAAVLRLDTAAGGGELAACVVTAGERRGGDQTGGQALVHELRAYLAARLPDFMVPAAVLFCDALPATTSGKTDRRALAAHAAERLREERGQARAAEPPRDAIEAALHQIWGEVLGRPGGAGIGRDDSFFDLGGHSLLAVRLMARIRQRFGRELPLHSLFRAATVELQAALLRAGAASAGRSVLVTLTPRMAEVASAGHPATPAPRPFFCVHPGGGNVLCYAELARALGPEQPFHGLELPDPQSLPARPTIEHLAARYLLAVRQAEPAGPIALGGWSIGAAIAYEMARQAQLAGDPVAALILIDPSPLAACAGPARPAGAGAGRAGSACVAADLAAPAGGEIDGRLAAAFAWDLARLAGHDPAHLARTLGDATPQDRAGRSPEDLTDALHAAGLLPAELGREDLAYLYQLFHTTQDAFRRYQPAPYSGEIILLRASRPPGAIDRAGGTGDTGEPATTAATAATATAATAAAAVSRHSSLARWAALARAGTEITSLDGDHYSIVQQPAQLAQALRRHLRSAATMPAASKSG